MLHALLVLFRLARSFSRAHAREALDRSGVGLGAAAGYTRAPTDPTFVKSQQRLTAMRPCRA